VICENYNECYHCAHPELCAVVPAFRERGGAGLDWTRGVPHRPGAYTFTRSGTTRRRPLPGLHADEQLRHKGELICPNLFLSLACDHAAVFILQPKSAARTEIVCHFLFEPYELAKSDFDARDTSGILTVNRWTGPSVRPQQDQRPRTARLLCPMEDYNLDIPSLVLQRIGDAVGTA
jgi:Rieske 2Fe-2S family protein